MITVNLHDLTGLPETFIKGLHSCNSHFRDAEFLENIREIPAVLSLIKDIDEFCSQNQVIGFHYTRAIPEDLLTQGLQPRSGDQIRQQFLSRWGHKFGPDEIDTIKSAWASYFDKSMRRSRDNVLRFNFTKTALSDGGAEWLLKYYGGEQVYFCLINLPGIDEVLTSIGTPLIVKCELNPSDVSTYIDCPWGSIAVSSFHRRINPEADQVAQDGLLDGGVSPDRLELIIL